MPETGQRSANRVLIVIGLAIALGAPFAHLSAIANAFPSLGSLWSREAPWLWLFLIVILYVLLIERRPLSSIGFHRISLIDIGLGILAAVVIVAGDIVLSIVEAILHMAAVKPAVASLFATPLWFRAYLCLRAPIEEEVLFRGYGFERLTELTGRTWIAAVVTFVLFAAAHYSGGGPSLALVAAWGGFVLTVLYLWRRNLWATITAHILTDVVGLLLVPALQAHH